MNKRQVKRVKKADVQSKNIEREIRRAIGLVDSYKRKYPAEFRQVVDQMQTKEI